MRPQAATIKEVYQITEGASSQQFISITADTATTSTFRADYID